MYSLALIAGLYSGSEFFFFFLHLLHCCIWEMPQFKISNLLQHFSSNQKVRSEVSQQLHLTKTASVVKPSSHCSFFIYHLIPHQLLEPIAPQRALSSQQITIKSPSELNYILHLLKSYGLTNAQLATTITKRRILLSFDPAIDLRRKLNCFLSTSYSGDNLSVFILKTPPVYGVWNIGPKQLPFALICPQHQSLFKDVGNGGQNLATTISTVGMRGLLRLESGFQLQGTLESSGLSLPLSFSKEEDLPPTMTESLKEKKINITRKRNWWDGNLLPFFSLFPFSFPLCVDINGKRNGKREIRDEKEAIGKEVWFSFSFSFSLLFYFYFILV